MEGVVESEDSPNENFEEEEEEEDPNLENQEDEEDEDYQENSSTTVKRKRPLAGISTSHAHISDASHDQPAKKEKKDIVSVAVEEEEEVPEETSPHVDPATLTPYTGTADALPYQLDSLTWDRNHRRNNQHVYCYCGKARTRWSPMLQCSSCRQWFHVECLKQKPKPTPLAGDTAYSFKCAICNNNTEYYQTLTKNWTDIVRVAIYNLLVQEKHRGGSKRFFQYKDEICSFIDKHWDSLCYEKTRTKTWENTIGSALSTKAHYFKSGAEEIGSSGYWGLHNEDDPAFVKESTRGISRQNKDKGFKKKAGGMKGPSSYTKKKGEEKKKLKPVPTIIYYPRLYFDPVAYGYTELRLAKENSAPQVKIHDRFTASNEKGHRMVRASFGVTDGIWYYEIEIPQHSGNTRLGWSSEKGDVQAPVGYDKYSYSYRDKEGTKFHQSRGSPYGAAYGPGDVIGFLINLPPNPNREKKPEPIQDISQKKKEEEEPARLNNSEIRFYKNGEDQGVAFSNIYEGTYYPAGSLYGGGMAKFNFGPTFKYPPRDIQFRPCCEVAAIVLEEARKAAEAAKATEAQAATENGVNSTHQNDNENNGTVKMEMESTPPPLTV